MNVNIRYYKKMQASRTLKNNIIFPILEKEGGSRLLDYVVCE